MKKTPVCIIGAGPIGLAGTILLARLGIDCVLIERRSEVNTHPRSRFVDTNTMELMRLFGIEKEVEETGLGPDWTEYNRWFNALVKEQIAAIPSPTFHTVPRTTSPTMPVMTCQDYVENVLLTQVHGNEHIELCYRTEVVELTQDESGTTVAVRNLESGEETTIRADYTIGSDGPHSFVRQVIGSTLEAEPLPLYSQDVIFEADLSEYVEGRKGGLLYNVTPHGVLVFQPLNGVTRWRCQIFTQDTEPLPDDETIERIREAVGTEDEVPISITSTGMWQPTPGCVDRLAQDRIFLAGDAAHVTVPTGGMGNNIGFAGIRNLTWKLAFVLKGLAPPDILKTYEPEMRPCALLRIETGLQTTRGMAGIFSGYLAGEDTSDAVYATRQYADYDGVILGFEHESALIAQNPEPPPAVDNSTIDFVPAVRAGRRAPHAWVNESEGHSVLDWFGWQYVLVAGASVSIDRWRLAVDDLRRTSEYPIELQQLPATGIEPYGDQGLVLVRPDGIIADYWNDFDVSDDSTGARLRDFLPMV